MGVCNGNSRNQINEPEKLLKESKNGSGNDKEISENKPQNFDENLYSRQLFTFGKLTMQKLMTMKVLIQGLRGVGLEVAKNLILAGPKKVILHDNTVCTTPDLGTNFYIKESDITTKKTRSEACTKSLSELNPYVEVEIFKGDISTTVFTEMDINVVVFTECYDKDFLIEINEYCRTCDPVRGFIWTGCLGLFGHAFLDYGEKHMIIDKNGEELHSMVIQGITAGEKTLVQVMEDKRHGFADGDYVIFSEVQGMTEINDKSYEVTVVSPYTFTIDQDIKSWGAYTSGGYATQVNVPFAKKFNSLATALKEPYGPGCTEMIDPDMDFER